ncbi:MAG: hypothetical protein AB7L94_35580, partial [Kofleriaceae bacterium]
MTESLARLVDDQERFDKRFPSLLHVAAPTWSSANATHPERNAAYKRSGIEDRSLDTFGSIDP